MEDPGPVARNLRIWMEFRGFGQKALARKAGLNETYVRDILKGKSRNPTQSRLSKLAIALDCSVNDLTGDGAESRYNDLQRAAWNAAFDRLSPGDREFLIRSAQGLVSDDPPDPIPFLPRTQPPLPPPVGGSVQKNEAMDGCPKVRVLKIG